jgi:hypothetical protein
MKTSNVIAVAAAATLLTALELGLAATILGGGTAAISQPIVEPLIQQSQLASNLSFEATTLEPIVVVAAALE